MSTNGRTTLLISSSRLEMLPIVLHPLHDLFEPLLPPDVGEITVVSFDPVKSRVHEVQLLGAR